MTTLRKRFHVGQTVFVKEHYYEGNKSAYRLRPVTLTGVGTKYLAGDAWWAKKIHPSAVYLTEAAYEAELFLARVNDEFYSLLYRDTWKRRTFTVEQIRAACEALGVTIPAFAAAPEGS